MRHLFGNHVFDRLAGKLQRNTKFSTLPSKNEAPQAFIFFAAHYQCKREIEACDDVYRLFFCYVCRICFSVRLKSLFLFATLHFFCFYLFMFFIFLLNSFYIGLKLKLSGLPLPAFQNQFLRSQQCP